MQWEALQHLDLIYAHVVNELSVLYYHCPFDVMFLFCLFTQAHKRGMFYPHYVFISYYWFSDFWWTDPILKTSSHTYDPVNCTKLELTEAVFRSLSVDYYPMPAPGEEDVPTDVGYVSGKLEWY